jgi:hypothetical protein
MIWPDGADKAFRRPAGDFFAWLLTRTSQA